MDKIIANRFEIIDELGEGGMGKVWLATDRQTGKVVAFKLLMEFAKERQSRFEREVSAIKAMDHDSIVKFVASGIHNDLPYIVTDFVAGRPISHENGLDKNLAYMQKIIDALEYIHNKGIVHRDIKPSNIIVAGDQAMLMDFGVSLDVNLDRLTDSGNVVGTVSYMSPEQLYGLNIDHRSDIYSAGIVLYELVTGKHPFHSNYFPDLISMITTTKPDSPHSVDSDIPEELSKIIMKTLEKDPEKRYQTASELKKDLESFISGNAQPSQKETIEPSIQTYPFVGREKELLKFGNWLKELRLGKGFACNVKGPLGIGKTKLLLQLMSMALSRSVKFVIVNQDNTASDMPALSSLLDHLSFYDLGCDMDAASKLAYEIRQYSPAFANKLGLDKNAPKRGVENVHEAFAELVISCFAGKPVIFAFEDNIDSMTKAVARELAEFSLEKNIGVIINTSSDDTVKWNLPQSAKTIELAPLNSNEIAKLAESVMGDKKASKKILDEIVEKSKGFPLICVSLALEYGESKETDTLKAMLDKTSMIFTKSFMRLSDESKTIVEAMSLMTFPVNAEQLQAVLGLSNEKMIKCVMELRHTGLTAERFNGLRMLFEIASPVVRWHIERQIPPQKKQAIHNLIAISAENRDVQDDPVFRCEAAKHFIYCGKPRQAIDVVLSATRELMEENRPLIAEKYLQLIFPLMENIDDENKNYDFLMLFIDALAKNKSMVDISPLIMHSYIIIRNKSFGNSSKLSLTLGIIRLANFLERHDITREFSDYGLKFVDRATSQANIAELHMHVAFSELQSRGADQKKMLSYSKNSVSLAQKTKDRELISKTMGMYATCLCEAKQYKESNDAFEKAAESASELANQNVLLVILYNYSISLILQSNFTEATRICKEIIKIANDADNTYYMFLGMHGLARCHTIFQNYKEAAMICEEIMEMARKHDPGKVPPWAYMYPCEYELLYMKLELLGENANKMHLAAKNIGEVFLISFGKYCLADLAYYRHEYVLSCEHLNEVKSDYSAEIIFSPERLHSDLAKSYSANGQFDKALESIEELENLLKKRDNDDLHKNLIEKFLYIAEANTYFKIISSKDFSFEVKKQILEKTKKNLEKKPKSEQIINYDIVYDFVPPLHLLPEIAHARGLTLLCAKELEIKFNKSQVVETLEYIESTLEFMLKYGFKKLWNELANLRFEIMKLENS